MIRVLAKDLSVLPNFVLIAMLVFVAAPVLSCENPYKIMARKPVPLVDQPVYAQAFNTCFDAFIADVPEAYRGRVTEVINELLLMAVRAGDVVAVRRMIEEKAIREGQSSEYTDRQLNDAIWAGHTEVVRLLLQAGASPHGRGEGASPLFIAIREGHADIARALFEVQGTIRRPPQAPEDVTLIEEVIYRSNGAAAMIALLIAQGYDPSEPMSSGDLPIHAAAALGDGETLRALVLGGADIEAQDRQGHTPLETAASTFLGISALPTLVTLQAKALDGAIYEAELNGNDMHAAYLKAIGNAKAQQAVLDRALITFIQHGRGDKIAALLRAGADPNAFLGAAHSLHITQCAPRIGEILLDYGADPDLARVNAATPEWVAQCAAYSDEARRYINRLEGGR